MAYFLQNYKDGHIAREGDKYQYVTAEGGKEKVVGTYDSIDALVKANPTADGKEAQSGQRSVADTSTSDVSSASTTKESAKKPAKRSAKK